MKTRLKQKGLIAIIALVVILVFASVSFFIRSAQISGEKKALQEITAGLKTINQKYSTSASSLSQKLVKAKGKEGDSYMNVLKAYVTMLNEASKPEANPEIITASKVFDDKVADSINGYISEPNIDYYYAYVDIDHNKTNELVIGKKVEDGIQPIEIYGFNNGKVTLIADETLLGDYEVDLSEMTISKDGYITVYGDYGDQAAYLQVGKLDKNGYSFKSEKMYIVSQSGKENNSNAEELEKVREKHPDNVKYSWNQFVKPGASSLYKGAYTELIKLFDKDENYRSSLVNVTSNELPALYLTNKKDGYREYIKSYMFIYTDQGLKSISFGNEKVKYYETAGYLQVGNKYYKIDSTGFVSMKKEDYLKAVNDIKDEVDEKTISDKDMDESADTLNDLAN